MKTSNKKKILITALLAVAVLILGGTMFTLAMLTSVTDIKSNTFTVGSVKTEIVEDYDSEGKKEVSIKNTGLNDCIVRVRVNVSPKSVQDKVKITGWSRQWVDGGDGFYYYQGILGSAESTPPVFTGYEIDMNKENFVPFDITVYQESVQSVVHDGNGNSMSAVNAQGKYEQEKALKIWSNYNPAK